MGINEYTVFHAPYPRIVAAVIYVEAQLTKSVFEDHTFLVRQVAVRWALRLQLQISFPHADRAKLRPGVNKPEGIL